MVVNVFPENFDAHCFMRHVRPRGGGDLKFQRQIFIEAWRVKPLAKEDQPFTRHFLRKPDRTVDPINIERQVDPRSVTEEELPGLGMADLFFFLRGQLGGSFSIPRKSVNIPYFGCSSIRYIFDDIPEPISLML